MKSNQPTQEECRFELFNWNNFSSSAKRTLPPKAQSQSRNAIYQRERRKAQREQEQKRIRDWMVTHQERK